MSELDRQRRYRRKHRQEYLRTHRRGEWKRNLRKLGTTPEYYMGLMAAQHGQCAICGESKPSDRMKDSDRPLALDHNHITGQLRGLLCGRCNKGLGYFRDSEELLRKAAKYLKSWAIFPGGHK